jgi:trans-aconitate 2-methyltransferase
VTTEQRLGGGRRARGGRPRAVRPLAGRLGGPWKFAGPEETRARLERAGCTVDRVWLSESPQRPPDVRAFLAGMALGAHLDRLPAELRDPYVDAVVEGLRPNPVHDYVRLNLVARAA